MGNVKNFMHEPVEAGFDDFARMLQKDFNPDQPRDEQGRFAGSGGEDRGQHRGPEPSPEAAASIQTSVAGYHAAMAEQQQEWKEFQQHLKDTGAKHWTPQMFNEWRIGRKK